MPGRSFHHRRLGESADAMAPDGSEVRLLATGARGSMAHFRLPAGAVARAIRHRSVEELWYFVAGRGRMWRKDGEAEEVLEVHAGLSLNIPVGVSFQFRADGDAAGGRRRHHATVAGGAGGRVRRRAVGAARLSPAERTPISDW